MIRKRTEAWAVLPSRVRPFPSKLDLRCSECRTTAKYAVGAVMLDPCANHRVFSPWNGPLARPATSSRGLGVR